MAQTPTLAAPRVTAAVGAMPKGPAFAGSAGAVCPAAGGHHTKEHHHVHQESTLRMRRGLLTADQAHRTRTFLGKRGPGHEAR